MKKKIMIKGMTCGHCTGRVERTLKEEDLVKSVVVDLEGNNAVVELSADLSDQAIRELIDDAGFDVTGIENL